MLEMLELTSGMRLKLEALGSPANITDDMADELRDFCIDLLDTTGFDEHYKLTKAGEKIDELIDKLFVG
ncbi:MAG: hypothetical protein RIG26_09675 [Thalassospira sp.]|uniref:hypothetical protein n=1 Tax=Thalassospira sp. TaxID=1912094 RepID=UPI0032EDB181